MLISPPILTSFTGLSKEAITDLLTRRGWVPATKLSEAQLDHFRPVEPILKDPRNQALFQFMQNPSPFLGRDLPPAISSMILKLQKILENEDAPDVKEQLEEVYALIPAVDEEYPPGSDGDDEFE
jgi:hypothetical protein